MTKSIQATILALSIIILTNIGISQVKIMAKPGEIFDLSELGAIILLKENKVIVEFVMPAEGRHADYREIDIKKDDEILYANGKKIESTVELEKIYDKSEIGYEIKLGIKRNDELGIVTFIKADPEALPKKRMIKVKVKDNETSDGNQEVEIDGKKYKAKDGKVVIDGKEMKIEDLMEHVKEKSSANDEKKINTTNQ